MYKNKSIHFNLLIIVNIFLVLTCASLYYSLNKITPLQNINIKGFYQSVQYLPDVYNYTFTQEKSGEYTININYEVETGTYERYEDNVYILHRESGKELIILLNEGFYIYDNENNRLIKMIKKSDIPTYINKPYWNIQN